MIPVHKRETLTELAEAITRAKSVFRFGEDVTIADLLHQCCDTHENQLTQDLATARAEIARLRDALTEISELRSTTTNFGVPRAMAKLALSQSPPSLQEYRDMKADAERYRRIRENWLDCDELELHGRLAVIDNRIDEVRLKSC